MDQTVTIIGKKFTYEMLHPFLMKAERRQNTPYLQCEDDSLLKILWFEYADTLTMTILEVGPVKRYVNRAVNPKDQNEYDARAGYMAPPEMSHIMEEWSDRYQGERRDYTDAKLKSYYKSIKLAGELQEAVHRMHLTAEDYETVVFSQNLLIVPPQTINVVLFARRWRENRSSVALYEFCGYEHLLPSYIWSDAKQHHKDVHRRWKETFNKNDQQDEG
ncbi:MAG: hypothetical protein Q9212_004075 [Teloschistes hypoglaucus]